MKKIILIVCLTILCTLAFAKVRPILNVNPYFMLDTTPASGAKDDSGLKWKNETGAQNDNWYMNRQDYWLHIFEKPAFFNVGFEVDTDKIDMVFDIDINQDRFQNFNNGGANKTNIPFLGATIDLNFPAVGYVDYTSEDGNIYASLGRRQIKWGPSTYDMAISDSQPYLDHFYAEFNDRFGKDWNFKYSFTTIAYKYFMNYGEDLENGPKTTFAHKIGFENSFLRITLAELNNVYGKYPTLLDCTPFGVWHNNYQDNYSNVMLNVALEGKVGPVRAFGTFTMDDFDLPHEASGDEKFNSQKPAAIGITAGVEVNLLDGNPIEKRNITPSDFALKEDTFKVETGLNVGYEFYYCSKFMYNRNNNAGKFMMPYQFISFACGSYQCDETAFYLGFKYGPDTKVHRLYAEYTNNPLEAFASVELMKRGSYGIDSTYEKAYFNANLETPYDITTPVTKVLMLKTGAAYQFQPGLKANAQVGYTKDLTHGTGAFQATLGGSISVFDVDWKNLF